MQYQVYRFRGEEEFVIRAKNIDDKVYYVASTHMEKANTDLKDIRKLKYSVTYNSKTLSFSTELQAENFIDQLLAEELDEGYEGPWR